MYPGHAGGYVAGYMDCEEGEEEGVGLRLGFADVEEGCG